MKTNSLYALAALTLLIPQLAFAVGDVNGRIRGTVTEADSGAPVPGATVTVSGKKLIGGAQVMTTSDDGTYEAIELPGGKYDVEVTYAGVKPIKRTVIVRQGEATPLDIVWSAELAAAEVTEVQAERHMTRPDSTQTGTVLSADTESRLATGRTNTDLAQQVVGVKADRGLPVVKGANRLSNHYLSDGMDITDSVTNNFATQVNFDSIASLEVLTGGMEAQYNALGGVVNVTTATGSDELHLDTSLYVNNSAFSANNVYGSQSYEHDLVFSTVNAGPTQGYNANFNISGPILKQKLWYNVSLEYDYNQQSLQPAPPINLVHPPRTEHDFHPRLKFSYAPTSKNRITLAASGDPALIFNRSQTNKGLGLTEYGQSQGGMFSVLQWDYFASQNLSTNLQTGFNYNTVHQSQMCDFMGGGSVNFGPRDSRFSDQNYKCLKAAGHNNEQPSHINGYDGTVWYNGGQENNDRRYTFQLDPSVSIRGKGWGEHDAKIGIQSRAVIHDFNQHTPGLSVYNDLLTGAPFEAGLCNETTGVGCNLRTDTPDFKTHAVGFGVGFFAQDRWKVLKRLTILPGIRLDYGTTKNTAGQTVTDSWGVGPRLGFALDLTGDQKTIFTGYYGRANDTLTLLPAQYADPQGGSTINRWDPNANGGKGGFVFRNATNGAGGYVLDPHATTPHTDEITFGLNREFFHDSVASIGYTYKRMSNIWEEVEVNQIWDPSGSRVIGYANGKAQTVNKFTTPDQAYRNYHGLDFAVESRPTPNWDVYAGYTLSWLFGPGADDVGIIGAGSGFANPRQMKFYDGYLPEDSRHNVKLHASYNFHGLVAGANLTYSTGTPLTKVYWNANNGTYSNRRTPSGTDAGAAVNDPSQVASFHVPDQLIVNVRISYDFKEVINQHLIIMADFFNLFNFDTPTGLTATDTPTFGQANTGRIAPLRMQLAARYLF